MKAARMLDSYIISRLTMDETYKILIAGAVGFILSPLNDGIKNLIYTWRSKRKLIQKLKISHGIMKNSIPGLNGTAQKREAFIKEFRGPENGEAFTTPTFRFPDIEKEIEDAYSLLSNNQKHLLVILVGAQQHIAKLMDKIEKQEEDLREFLHQKYQINQEDYSSTTVKNETNNFYRRILSCEKAIVFTACTVYSTTEKILADVPQLATNEQMLRNVSESLDITLRMDWWPYLRRELPSSNTELEHDELEQDKILS